MKVIDFILAPFCNVKHRAFDIIVLRGYYSYIKHIMS